MQTREREAAEAVEGAGQATLQAQREREEAGRRQDEVAARGHQVAEGEAALRLRGRELEELTVSLQDQQARLVRRVGEGGLRRAGTGRVSKGDGVGALFATHRPSVRRVERIDLAGRRGAWGRGLAALG